MIPENKQKLVFALLQKIFKERTILQQAFNVWRSDYAKTQELSADHLIGLIEKEIGLNADEKRALRISYHSLQARGEDALPAVPNMFLQDAVAASTTPSSGSKGEAPAVKRPAHEVVFTHLLSNLLAPVALQNPDAVDDMAESIGDEKTIRTMKLTPAAERAYKKWLNDIVNTPFDSSGVELKEMQQIFHQVYIAMCEELGPVDTDRILNRAVDKTNNLPEAMQYPPSKIL